MAKQPNTAEGLEEFLREDKYTEFRIQCSEGSAESCYSLANWWLAMNDHEQKAREILHNNCYKRRHNKSCLSLGLLYLRGVAPLEGGSESNSLFSRTTPKHMQVIKLRKNNPHAVTRDLTEACRAFKSGCDCDPLHPICCQMSANMFGLGEGVPRSKRTEFLLHKRACVRGAHPPSCLMTALTYLRGCADAGVEQDKKKAFQYMKQSCDGEFYHGCTNLAVMYSRGDGVAKDLTKAAVCEAKARKIHTPDADTE